MVNCCSRKKTRELAVYSSCWVRSLQTDSCEYCNKLRDSWKFIELHQQGGIFRLCLRTLLVGPAGLSSVTSNRAFSEVYFASISYYFWPSIVLGSIECSGWPFVRRMSVSPFSTSRNLAVSEGATNIRTHLMYFCLLCTTIRNFDLSSNPPHFVFYSPIRAGKMEKRQNGHT